MLTYVSHHTCVFLAVRAAAGWSIEAVLGPSLTNKFSIVTEQLTEPSARRDDNLLHELSRNQDVPIRNMVLLPKTSWENSGAAKILCSQPPRIFLTERWVHDQEGPWVRRNMGQVRWLARDNLKTNPITIKPETVSHVAERFSWVPLPYCSPPRCPFPIKSFYFVSTCVSSGNSFTSVRAHSQALEGVSLPATVLPIQCDTSKNHGPGIRRCGFPVWLCCHQMLNLGTAIFSIRTSVSKSVKWKDWNRSVVFILFSSESRKIKGREGAWVVKVQELLFHQRSSAFIFLYITLPLKSCFWKKRSAAFLKKDKSKLLD